MKYNYASILKTAGNLIDRFGMAYEFVRTADRVYSPSTGKVGQREHKYSANAKIIDFEKSERSGEAVQQGDIKMIAEAADYKIGDLVTINCENYRIINVMPITGADFNLACYLHLRQ